MAIVAKKGWNLDTVLAYLKKEGGQLDRDLEGQFLIYTNLTEDARGNLVEMEN